MNKGTDMHYHDILYEKMKFKYTELGKIEILRKSLKNYRTGKGLNLEYEAFTYLSDNMQYNFSKFPKPLPLSSRDLVILDTQSSSPYYIGKTDIWLTDSFHITTLSLVDNFMDFLILIKS